MDRHGSGGGLPSAAAAVLACLLAACAVDGRYVGGLRWVPTPISYQVRTVYGSDLGDPYLVMSGPAETYRAYRLNDRYRRALDAYAAGKSTPASPRALVLQVGVLDLATGYEAIGGRSLPSPGAVSRTGRPVTPAPAVQLAARGLLPPLALRGGLLEDDRFESPLPHEIRKSAVLTLDVAILFGDRVLVQRQLRAEATEVFERMFDHDRRAWAYDYTRVFMQVFDKALILVDPLVDEAVAALEAGA